MRRVVGGVLATALRPGRLQGLVGGDGRPVGYRAIAHNLLVLSVPLLLTVGTFAATWWYVVIYNAPEVATAGAPAPSGAAPAAAPVAKASVATTPAATEDKPQELGAAGESESEPAEATRKTEGPEEMTSLRDTSVASEAGKVPAHFYAWFWGLAAACGVLLFVYFWRMDGEQLEILKELCASVVPLGVLTIVVLAVILFGICTATESAAIGALGALYLAVMAKFMRPVLWWSLIGFVVGVVLGWAHADFVELLVSGSLGATFLGTVVPVLMNLKASAELRRNIKEATFLTAKTTAMVCWLFVGSALFSAVFALHGGQGLIERWVLSMNLSPLGFQFMAQVIIFLLGWPLEWTEIIII